MICNKINKKTYFAAIVIFLIAALFRLHELNSSYWGDESLTHERASNSFYEAITSSSYPLYNTLAHLALKIDDTELMLRLPSFFAGIVGVLVLFFLVYRKAGINSAIIAASVLSLSVTNIQFSQDARYYALFVLAVMLSIYLLDGLKHDITIKTLILWTGVIAFGVLTHPFFLVYTFCLLIGLTISIFVLNAKKGLINNIKLISKITVATFIGLLPYTYSYFYKYLNFYSSRFEENDSSADKLSFTLRFEDYVSYIYEYLSDFGYIAWPIIIILLAVGILYYIKQHSYLGITCLATILGPLPLCFIEVSHWYALRYFCFLQPILILVTATGLAKSIEYISKIAQHKLPISSNYKLNPYFSLAISIFTVIFIISSSQYNKITNYYEMDQPPHDWKSIAQKTTNRLKPNDILFMAAGYHNETESGSYVNHALNYYLEKYNPNCAAFFAYNDQFKYSGVNIQNFIDVIDKHPNQTIWAVSNKTLIDDKYIDLIKNYSDEYYDTGRIALGIFGEPTTNLIHNGSIDPGKFTSQHITNETNFTSHPQKNNNHIVDITLEKPNSNHAVRFPVVRDENGNPTNRLDNNTVYTLSFQAKLDNIEHGLYWSRVCKIVVFGKKSNGSDYWVEKLLLRGTHNWETYQLQLITGQNVPNDLQDVGIAIGLFGGTGTFQFYNVQLEKKFYRTPFTDSIRNRNFLNEYKQ